MPPRARAPCTHAGIDLIRTPGRDRCILVKKFTTETLSIVQVPASFSFVPLAGRRAPAPRAHAGSTTHHHQPCTPAWLAVSPARGVLAPGEAMSLHLTASVAAGELDDCLAAEDLAASACTLDVILTLRIDGGADHFVVVSGSFLPSFFGLTMTTLSSAPRPCVGMSWNGI